MFHSILYQPLFNALFYIYNVLPISDFGLAIIILTLLIKFILFFPSGSSLKSQKALQELQPKMDEVRAKHKGNQEVMAKELMKLYKENKVNPLSSCLPLLIQLPILWALYRVFISGLHTDPATGILVGEQLQDLYQPLRDIFVTTPVSTSFLGFNLADKGNYIFAIIAGGLQFLQSRMLSHRKPPIKTQGAKDENAATLINKQMMYFLPVITVVFGIQFPAGLTLYWIVSTAFTILQQLYFFRGKKQGASPTPPPTPAVSGASAPQP